MVENNVIRVIALDPGGTTGWAKGLIREGRMWVVSGQAKWNHKELYDSLEAMNPDHIICERFDYRKSSKQKEGVELISREFIGVTQLYVQQHPSKRIYLQMPQEALGGYWGTDESLKNDSVYMVDKPHANDAMRHLLQWFVFKEGFQFNKEGFARLDLSGYSVDDKIKWR